MASMVSVADTAIAFHMVGSMPRVLPAALGAVETTPIREAGAYASIDAGGREVMPSLIDSVQDRNGQVVWRSTGMTCPACDDPATPPQAADNRKQIADPASVYQLVTMMEGVVQRGTGMPAGVGLNHPIAGIIVSLRRRHRMSGDCTKLLVGIAQGCGRFRNLYGDERMFHVDMTRVARGGQVFVRRSEAF